MADTGSPDRALIGNSIVLFPPFLIKTQDGTVVFDENGWHVPMIPNATGTLGLSTSSRKWTNLYLSEILNVNGDAGVLHQRHRVTVAEMNAGHTLLAAVTGLKYRLVDVKVITIGGNAGATADATGIAVYGVQATVSTALYTALLAALTQHAVCQINTANTSVQNSGASFVANDAAAAITCRAVSAGAYDLITATHFDILLSYVLEA
jgi:hypothetical protein